jgi:pimeloyl-ACP methyl ester carboxylesterase
MQVELVRTVTRDGLRLDGALTRARSASEGSGCDAALLLHGVGGSFYSVRTLEPLIAKLNDVGVTTLVVNTRGHDAVFEASLGNVRRRFGAAYEIVDECRLDITAWMELLQSRGFQRVALMGHSLGAIKAVYAQAHARFPLVHAVAAISGPRLSYSAFMNAPESSRFWESMQTAEQMVRKGQGEELFTSKFPFPLLISAASYIDKYGPAERYNLLKFAGEFSCPVLFTYGTKELAGGGVAFAGMPEALGGLAGGERRTIRVIDGADHFYTGVGDVLAQTVVDWLQAP